MILYLFMGFFSKVTKAVKEEIKTQGLEMYHNLPLRIQHPVTSTRDDIRRALVIPAGSAVDTAFYGFLESIGGWVGKAEKQVTGDAKESNTSRYIRTAREWYHEKMLPVAKERLVRNDPEPFSDQDIIRTEQEEMDMFGNEVSTEAAVSLKPLSKAGLKLEKALAAKLMNRHRNIKAVFPDNHELTKKMRRRASHIITNNPKNLAHFSRAIYEPTLMSENEDETEYVQNRRKIQDKRDSFGVSEYWFNVNVTDLDLNSGDTINLLLDKLGQKKEFQEFLNNNANQISLVMQPSKDGVTIGAVAIQDQSARLNNRVEDQPSPPNNKWWFDQIPEEKRGADSNYSKIYNGADGKEAYADGFGLYGIYLFEEELKRIKADKNLDINIEPIKVQRNGFILGRKGDYLELYLNIPGKSSPEILKLVRGTHTVELPEKSIISSAIIEEEGVMGDSQKNYLTIDEYLEKLSYFTEDDAGEDRLQEPAELLVGAERRSQQTRQGRNDENQENGQDDPPTINPDAE